MDKELLELKYEVSKYKEERVQASDDTTFREQLLELLQARNIKNEARLKKSTLDLQKLAKSHRLLRLWRAHLSAECDELEAQWHSSEEDLEKLTRSHNKLSRTKHDLQTRCNGLLARLESDDQPCLSCRVSLSKIDMLLKQFNADGWFAGELIAADETLGRDHTTCNRWHDKLH